MRPRLSTKGLIEIGETCIYTRDLPHSNIFFLSEYHLFHLEVNLMPYGFCFGENSSNSISTPFFIMIELQTEKLRRGTIMHPQPYCSVSKIAHTEQDKVCS